MKPQPGAVSTRFIKPLNKSSGGARRCDFLFVPAIWHLATWTICVVKLLSAVIMDLVMGECAKAFYRL